MQGRLLYAQIDGGSGCRLKAVRLYIRPFDPVQEFDWPWVEVSVLATPEGWSAAKLPDIARTSDEFTAAKLPNIFPTPDGWDRAPLPIAGSPDADWVELTADLPNFDA